MSKNNVVDEKANKDKGTDKGKDKGTDKGKDKDKDKINVKPSIHVVLIFIMIVMLLITFTVIDFIYENRMVVDSANFSKHLQDASPDAGTGLNIFGEGITFVVICYVLFATFFRHNKFGPFLRFFGIGVIIWFNVILRIAYGDGRPSDFFTFLKGSGDYCETDFGNPSGHTLMVVPISLFVFFDLYEENFKGNKLFIFFGILLATLFSLAVIFVRLFLGVHSYNQLILGALWGYFIVALLYLLKGLIYRYILCPILKKDKYENYRCTARIIFFVIFVFWNVPSYVAFAIRHQTHAVGSSFYNSIVNCLEVKDNFEKNFATKIIAYGLIYNWFLFFYIGLNDCPMNVKYGTRWFEDRNIGRFILRFLLFAAINLPLILSFIPEEDDVLGTILRPTFLLPIFGYLAGRFLVPLEKKCNLYKQMETKPVNQ